MKEQNIEKLFKDTFSKFEADVNPSMWANIEQGLPASPQNVPGNSPVAKPSGIFGKFGLNAVILLTVMSAALIGTTVYLSSDKSASKDNLVLTVNPEPQSVQSNPAEHAQQTPVVSETISAPALQNNAQGEPAKKAADEKATAKPEEKVIQESSPAASQTSGASEKHVENTTGVNSVQVLVEPKAEQEPSGANSNAKVSVKEQVSVSMKKTSASDAGAENSQDNSRTYTPPAVESTPAGPTDLSNSVPAEGGVTTPTTLSEEQFRFFIPNVFTPNGDMLNDLFKPVSNLGVKDYEMTIYDRYGFELFKSRDINFAWDGRLKNGDFAASAVYVYIIKLTDLDYNEHDYIGSFALLK